MPEFPQRPTPEAREPLDRLRALCLALPGASERLSHGEPAWFVRKQSRPSLRGRRKAQLGGAEGDPATKEPDRSASIQFVTMADHHHDERVAFWAAAPEGAQGRWIALDPVRFFRPPYVGGRGWIGVYLDVEQDWDDVAEIVGDAHAVVTPRVEQR